MRSNDTGPLASLVVLDLTTARSGPAAARQFSDWGAEVIKIEPPGDPDAGDTAGLSRLSGDFQNLHRSKKSLTLNLKEADGLAIFYDLVRTADVVIENFRPGVKHRLKIDYESLRAINPRIVYGSISGFGQDGPYCDRPGYDQVAQGMGGLMSVTGFPEQGPTRVGIAISDVASGLYCAFGIAVALLERERSGVGQWVQASLLESQIALLDFQAARWLVDREVPTQAGNEHPTMMPQGVYRTMDGQINLAAPGDDMWRRFCAAIGGEALLEEVEFTTPANRSLNRAGLKQRIENILERESTQHWVIKLTEAGVPCGPIYSIDQTFEDPQVKHLGVARPIDHPSLGKIAVVGQPIKLTRTVGPAPVPAARRGEHTAEILGRLNMTSDRIEDLMTRKIV